jgi:hypothetical protein
MRDESKALQALVPLNHEHNFANVLPALHPGVGLGGVLEGKLAVDQGL